MSERADAVRRLVEASNASGWDPITVSEHVHPDVRSYPVENFPGPAVYEGRAGVVVFTAEFISTFDGLHWEIERLIEDGERVVVLIRMRGSAKTTGAPVDWRFGGIYGDFRDGLPAEVRFFNDQESALRAAGLEDG